MDTLGGAVRPIACGEKAGPQPQFCMAIDHVAIAVRDLEPAIRWYCDALGFDLVERRRTEGERTAMISAVLTSGTAVVVLIQGTSPESQVTRFVEAYGPGVQHMALSVSDMDAALARLPGGGAESAIELIEGEGLRQVFLRRDPESGVRVELVERTGGTFSDQSVERLFRAFEQADLF